MAYPRETDLAFLAGQGIKTLVNLTPDDYYSGLAEQHGVQMKTIRVPAFEPPTLGQIQEFLELIDSTKEASSSSFLSQSLSYDAVHVSRISSHRERRWAFTAPWGGAVLVRCWLATWWQRRATSPRKPLTRPGDGESLLWRQEGRRRLSVTSTRACSQEETTEELKRGLLSWLKDSVCQFYFILFRKEILPTF